MSTFLRFLNPLLMIAFGLGAGIVVARWKRDPWRLYGIGAWTFVLSQVFHLPFNGWVLEPWLADRLPDGPVPGSGLLVYAIALGLSAGVFEETARWLAFRLAVPQRRWPEAMALGAGHGGIEAVLLGILVLYQVLQLVALQGPDAALLLDPEQLDALGQAEAQIAAFWAAPWYGVLLGALERLFAICFHLSASVLVLQAFRRRNALWVPAAVLWHTVLNGVSVYTAVTWGPYWAEAVLAVLALVSIGIVFALREPAAPGQPSTPADTAPAPMSTPAGAPAPGPGLGPAPEPTADADPPPGAAPRKLSAEEIEDSRYG